MTTWQYLRLTWTNTTTPTIAAPWADLYLTEATRPGWSTLTTTLGTAGWELVCTVEERREQHVNANQVAGVLTSWTETYKRPADDQAATEYEYAIAAHTKRLEVEEAQRQEARQAAEAAALLHPDPIEASAAAVKAQLAARAAAGIPVIRQRYTWGRNGLMCIDHRVNGCATCGPPEGHRQVGSTWVNNKTV